MDTNRPCSTFLMGSSMLRRRGCSSIQAKESPGRLQVTTEQCLQLAHSKSKAQLQTNIGVISPTNVLLTVRSQLGKLNGVAGRSRHLHDSCALVHSSLSLSVSLCLSLALSLSLLLKGTKRTKRPSGFRFEPLPVAPPLLDTLLLPSSPHSARLAMTPLCSGCSGQMRASCHQLVVS